MLDFSYPTLYIPVSFMRPSSRTAAVNLIAAIKPFQPWVKLHYHTYLTLKAALNFLNRCGSGYLLHIVQSLYLLNFWSGIIHQKKIQKQVTKTVLVSCCLAIRILLHIFTAYSYTKVSFFRTHKKKSLIKTLTHWSSSQLLGLYLAWNWPSVSFLELGVSLLWF